MNTKLRDVTDYSQFDRLLFRPGFLADKWPVIDFYVELTKVKGKQPYFFAQTNDLRRIPLQTSACGQ